MMEIQETEEEQNFMPIEPTTPTNHYPQILVSALT